MSSGVFRNQGKGQPHTDGSSAGSGGWLDLDHLLVYGNRAQRRWAQQQLDRIKKQRVQEGAARG